MAFPQVCLHPQASCETASWELPHASCICPPVSSTGHLQQGGDRDLARRAGWTFLHVASLSAQSSASAEITQPFIAQANRLKLLDKPVIARQQFEMGCIAARYDCMYRGVVMGHAISFLLL